MEKRKRWGASPAVRFMGQGNKAARTHICTAVIVPLQRIFGLGRQSSPPGCGGNRRGPKRVSHTSTTTGRPGRYRGRSPRWGSRWERGGSRVVLVAPLESAAAAASGGARGLQPVNYNHLGTEYVAHLVRMYGNDQAALRSRTW